MQGTLVNLNELLVGHKLFDIPVYQRSYAWEERNLEDLWEDLYYLDTFKQHYFGTVLLKDSGETAKAGLTTFKKFDVIDGQQRLTTSLILIREIISQMKLVSDDDMFQKQVADLEGNYLKYGNLYKLNPLDDDGDFFHEFVIDNKEFLASKTSTRSQRRLVEAKRFFNRRLAQEQEKRQSGFQDFLIELKDKVDGLQLMQYIVNSDADAIRIFETANDRGRPLSSLEKTKSFLMHTSYLGTKDTEGKVEARLAEINGRFSQIYQFAEEVSENQYIGRFGANDFQRYHFINYISPNSNASRRYVNELKDIVRNKLRQSPDECVQDALRYAEDLEQAFFAVQDIAARYDKKDATGRLLGKIFMVGRLGNIFPLLIAAWHRYSKEHARMAEILKLLEAFTFRVYGIGGYRSDAAVSRLSRMAHRVHHNRLDYDGLVRELKSVNLDYRNDRAFAENLHSQGFYQNRSRNDIKYLLSEYEIHIRNKSRQPLTLAQQEILSPEYQVEHIWAQNPSDRDEYDEATVLLHEQNVHRLGNLTIAPMSWNASMGNKPFEKKRDGDPSNDSEIPAYADSVLRVQQDLKDYSEWTPETIRKREDKIVKWALKRWGI